MNPVHCVTLCLIAALSLAKPVSAQEPEKPGPETPAAKAEAQAGESEPEPTEEEFKEEEAKTPDQKKRKEEIEKKACPAVDVKLTAETDKTTHPTPEPARGQALVYVIRPTMNGNKIQTKLGVDGKWVGVNRGHNYFFLQLDPGEHYFCSKAENKSTLAVKVEAGKTYFVEQKMKVGLMKARNKLALLPDEEGKKKLAKCHPSSGQEKR